MDVPRRCDYICCYHARIDGTNTCAEHRCRVDTCTNTVALKCIHCIDHIDKDVNAGNAHCEMCILDKTTDYIQYVIKGTRCCTTHVCSEPGCYAPRLLHGFSRFALYCGYHMRIAT